MILKASLGWPVTTAGHYRQRGSKHQFCGSTMFSQQWPEFYLVRTTTIIKFSAVSFVEKREKIVGSDMSSCSYSMPLFEIFSQLMLTANMLLQD